ncbi:hypothetical protein BC939DRAFT_462361 [Gamsiella multidivaricata]|uniref:uncharacterized protein n=1 Tax=Gamsiella multidivaricata TaxID=101098 RepID=UPI002220BC66|nr:uncharacterized protein BC939DRAFT_462361 [Gamsiella multidivaricata]KAI7818641.1 hypothetical protein BC939DRAFT_462361 [Gamsiella multidivaricata]
MCGANEDLAKGTSKGKTGDLGCENQEKTGDEGLLGVVEHLLQDNNVDGISGTGVAGSHGSNEDMFLDREGTRIEREFPAKEAELTHRQDTGHEVAQWEGNQGNDRITNRDLGLTEIKELVDEGDGGREEKTKEPHAEGVTWYQWVIRVCITFCRREVLC